MRVWDVDPHVLCDKHLLAQHAEVHFAIRCLESGWKTKWKDVERFRRHVRGLAWLGFCHTVTVAELKRRGKFANHRTPVTTIHREALADLNTMDYMDVLVEHDYPWTELNEGTPWERDGVTFQWYRSHEKDWSNDLVARTKAGII